MKKPFEFPLLNFFEFWVKLWNLGTKLVAKMSEIKTMDLPDHLWARPQDMYTTLQIWEFRTMEDFRFEGQWKWIHYLQHLDETQNTLYTMRVTLELRISKKESDLLKDQKSLSCLSMFILSLQLLYIKTIQNKGSLALKQRTSLRALICWCHGAFQSLSKWLQREGLKIHLFSVCVALWSNIHWFIHITFHPPSIIYHSIIHPSRHPWIRQASSTIHSSHEHTQSKKNKPWNQPLWPWSSPSSAVVAEIQPFSNQLSSSKNNYCNQPLESHLFPSESYAPWMSTFTQQQEPSSWHWDTQSAASCPAKKWSKNLHLK